MGRSPVIDLSPLVDSIKKQISSPPAEPKWVAAKWMKYFGEFCEYSLRTLESIVMFFWVLLNFGIIIYSVRVNGIPLTISLVSSSWVVVLFLAFPFLYRPLRKLLEEIKSVGNIHRDDGKPNFAPPKQVEQVLVKDGERWAE